MACNPPMHSVEVPAVAESGHASPIFGAITIAKSLLAHLEAEAPLGTRFRSAPGMGKRSSEVVQKRMKRAAKSRCGQGCCKEDFSKLVYATEVKSRMHAIRKSSKLRRSTRYVTLPGPSSKFGQYNCLVIRGTGLSGKFGGPNLKVQL